MNPVERIMTMTLQEAKDKISFMHFSVPFDKLLVMGSQLKVLEEAAELYARSKWDEACEHYHSMLIAHLGKGGPVTYVPPKPEFQP